MACLQPLPGYLARRPNPVSGKRSVVFDKALGLVDRPVDIPCGACLGCRLAKSAEWGLRCTHEAALYDDNCFVTLTYSDDCLPENSSLRPVDLQRFWKRLRSSLKRKIRYFACGEYGDRSKRPHYHAILFNFFPDDAVFYKNTAAGRLFTSAFLEEKWGFGQVIVGSVSFESAAYCARYTSKKLYGEVIAKDDPLRFREFLVCSLKPGIGDAWALSNMPEFVYDDTLVLPGGRKLPTPKRYLSVFAAPNGDSFIKVKYLAALQRIRDIRSSSVRDVAPGLEPVLLRDRETVLWSRFSHSHRSFHG